MREETGFTLDSLVRKLWYPVESNETNLDAQI